MVGAGTVSGIRSLWCDRQYLAESKSMECKLTLALPSELSTFRLWIITALLHPFLCAYIVLVGTYEPGHVDLIKCSRSPTVSSLLDCVHFCHLHIPCSAADQLVCVLCVVACKYHCVCIVVSYYTIRIRVYDYTYVVLYVSTAHIYPPRWRLSATRLGGFTSVYAHARRSVMQPGRIDGRDGTETVINPAPLRMLVSADMRGR
jgi:hypothetical protein